MIRIALGALLFATASFDLQAKEPRSKAAIAEFVRHHPCPATHQPRLPCPGWEIDHRQPLKCNGADTPANLQWLTVAAHRAKTKAEAGHCRGIERSDGQHH